MRLDMRFDPNPEIRWTLLDIVASKYLKEKPMGHLTELIGCLTRAWYDRTDPLIHTEKELLYFSIGFALEAVFLRDENYPEPGTREKDGITLTPDFIDMMGIGLDLKSTRMNITEGGPRPSKTNPNADWPGHWMKQFMAYALLLDNVMELQGHKYYVYHVGIVQLIRPDFIAGTFRFDEKEVMDNWAWLKERQAQYFEAFGTGIIPTPFTTNEEWECANCRYLKRCQEFTTSAASLEGGEDG